jgi:hypothetical protein
MFLREVKSFGQQLLDLTRTSLSSLEDSYDASITSLRRGKEVTPSWVISCSPSVTASFVSSASSGPSIARDQSPCALYIAAASIKTGSRPHAFIAKFATEVTRRTLFSGIWLMAIFAV